MDGRVLSCGTPVRFLADREERRGVICLVDLCGGKRCLNIRTSYDIFGEDSLLYQNVPMASVREIPVEGLPEVLLLKRLRLFGEQDPAFGKVYSSREEYGIASILNTEGRARLDGRYPLRVGRIVTNVLILDVGYPAYWRYVRDADGNDCSGYFHTSPVRRAEISRERIVLSTMNSIYTLLQKS